MAPKPATFPNDLTMQAVRAEVARTRVLFPGNRQMTAALMEEVGELAQALIDHDRGKATRDDVETEAIQVAAMAVRILEEGSAEFTYPGVA